jgi:restriction endonuclease Mrr
MRSRADEIHDILSTTTDGRLRVGAIFEELKKREGDISNASSVVSAAVRQDNATRKERGESPRFKHSGDGNEEYGYISLVTQSALQTSKNEILEKPEEQIPLLIEAANKAVKLKLKDEISKLTWQEFESHFLSAVLNSLGFTQIEITQRTRDGGKDAICEYQRGIVRSKVIVSAKHWGNSGVKVSLDEVQRVRGIASEADTAIIITSSAFSMDATTEASPKPGLRTVVLIDGDLIVDGCFKNQLGIEEVQSVPKLTRFVGLPKQEDQ